MEKEYKEKYIEKSISSIYQALSVQNINLALKASHDLILFNSLTDRKKAISDVDNLTLFELLSYVFNFLNKNGISLYHDFFIDFTHYTVFKKAYLRKFGIDSKLNAKLLCLEILSIVEFVNGDSSIEGVELSLNSYSKSLFASMNNDDFDNYSDEKSLHESTIMSLYFSILIKYFEITGKNFWDLDVSEFRFIERTELQTIIDIGEYILNPVTFSTDDIEELFNYASGFKLENFFDATIMVNQNIEYVIGKLEEFRISKASIEKKIYDDKPEATFHEVIYSSLGMLIGEDSYLLSEIQLSDKRFDLYWYKEDINLSALIELKVNDLSKVHEDVRQLEGYLRKNASKVFLKEPDFGVLVTLNKGTKGLEYIEEKLKANKITYKVVGEYIHVLNMEKPIIIFVIQNGSFKRGK